MRLRTLVLPACLLCLFAPVVWQTSHALPGLVSDLLGLFIDASHSPYDFRPWLDVLWSVISALLTFPFPGLAGGIWLGLSGGVCVQLFRGLRSPPNVPF